MPRLIVADDDPMVGATIEVSSQRQSLDVTLAYAGETEFAAHEARPFEMKPLNVHMPPMSGAEIICRLLHSRAPEIPANARTGCTQASRPARMNTMSACLMVSGGDALPSDKKEVP